MDSRFRMKIERLNELYHKVESGQELNPLELNERAILRDEIINYFKFTVTKLKEDNLKNH